MIVLVKMKFGSHLYGTDTPDSDTDFKGVFLPSERDVLLGRIPRTLHDNTKVGTAKNTKDDIDFEQFSLHYFLKLACDGETAIMDMLHAPQNMILESSPIWRQIVQRRDKFYTKNMRSFVGYARKQAAKYGCRGSRLNDAARVLEFCSSTPSKFTLNQVWEMLPEGEHIYKLPPDPNGVRMYEVCGRKVGETSTIVYMYDVVSKFHKSYGERAKAAANNEGIDWKAVSHALRAAYQIKSILTRKTIIFPLPEADYLRSVKLGERDYKTEVSPLLDEMLVEVEELALKSDLPERVDRQYWDDFLLNCVKDHFGYWVDKSL